MRIAIVGPGAVGGYLAGRLAGAGHEVALLGRAGAHLAAIRKHGLKLAVGEGAPEFIRLKATDNAGEIGPVEVVFLVVKGQDAPAAAQAMQPLLSRETPVVMVGNGIPWWYCYKLGGRHESRVIESVDPGGALYRLIGPERILGGVTNVGASVPEPGLVHMKVEQWFRLGEPDNSLSPRLEAVCEVMRAAGVDAQARDDIRSDIWHKLWGNAFYNPMSVLTGATIIGMADDPKVTPLIHAAMEEIRKVAEAFGIHSLGDIEKRIALARRLGAHKTSMLQDWEKGKPLELGAIVGAPVEMAGWEKVDVPRLSMLHTLTDKKQRVRDEHA